MKVKAIAEGYYNDELIKKGRVFNIKGDKLPKWCTLANGIETRNKDEDVSEPQTPAVPSIEGNEGPEVKEPEVVNEVATEGEGTVSELENVQTDAPEVQPEENAPEVIDEASPEAVSYLNRLIDEGVEKGVLIEDTDKKSIKEQIAELEKRLGRK